MRLLRHFVILCVIAPTAFASTVKGTYTENLTASWNGLTRYYDMYVPTSLSATPTLVVMLHPTYNQPQMPSAFDRGPLQELAYLYGFLVIWPVSTQVTTKNGSPSWYWDAYFLDNNFAEDPDDSGYIRSLILQFESEYAISNVFIMGMSSGAFMAHRVAIDSSDLVSGVGAASGQIYAETSPNTLPLPLEPVSVLMLNGDEDTEVGYCGSRHEWGSAASPASDVTLDYWAGVAGYSGTLPQLCTDGEPTEGVDGALVQSNGVTVQFIREVGVGHTWVTGTETVMWEFFQANERNE
jgi:poly(3-hydroxybutyrate) depolymerase